MLPQWMLVFIVGEENGQIWATGLAVGLCFTHFYTQFSAYGFSIYIQWMVKSKEQGTYINLTFTDEKT